MTTQDEMIFGERWLVIDGNDHESVVGTDVVFVRDQNGIDGTADRVDLIIYQYGGSPPHPRVRLVLSSNDALRLAERLLVCANRNHGLPVGGVA
jgi:hypothetical protein